MADPEDSALPDYELPPLEAYENEFKVLKEGTFRIGGSFNNQW